MTCWAEISNPREYNSWKEMRKRCTNKNRKEYRDYGARGIKVCARWNDFRTFLSDMGPRPKGTTLDRINNDGDYEPGNCRWATYLEQNRNRRASATQTHCGRGHEFSPSNTYINTAGKRECRICRQQAVTRYRIKMEGSRVQ
jgi:hypothetical protein